MLSPGDRYLRRPLVEEITSMKRSTLYAAIQRGDFPAPVKITARTSAWLASEVVAWMEARARARDAR